MQVITRLPECLGGGSHQSIISPRERCMLNDAFERLTSFRKAARGIGSIAFTVGAPRLTNRYNLRQDAADPRFVKRRFGLSTSEIVECWRASTSPGRW